MKKCISMLLATLMLLTMIPTAFAADGAYKYTQPCVVDYFNSFNGFVKQSGTVDTPNGFKPFLYADNWAKLLTSATDEGGANTYLKFGGIGSTAIMMPFDETIRTGKLRVSFDMKIQNPDTINRFYLYGHDNRKNDNPLDLMHQYEVEQDKIDEKTGEVIKDENGNPIKEKVTKTDYAWSKLIDIGITDKASQNLCLRGSSKDNQKIKIADDGALIDSDWYKYDMCLDFDNNSISLSLNGNEPITAKLGFTGLKSLYFFYTSTAAKNSEVYLDNLFIKHYPSGEYDNTEMVVDYAGNSFVNIANTTTIDVAFSEASKSVNETEKPVKAEFMAQSVIDSSVKYVAKSAVKKDTGVRLTFGKLTPGTYKIVCTDKEWYEGYFTKKCPTASNTFSTAGTAQNVKEQNILVEDDFENYTGGIPANAENIDGAKSCNSGEMTAAEGNRGGTALEIHSQQVIYRLPYALTGDRFSYEFDIKHTDGRWFTGILTEDTLSGKQSIHKKLYKSAIIDKTEELTQTKIDKSIGDYKAETNAIGCISYTEDPKDGAVGPEAVQYATSRLSKLNAKAQDLTCKKNEWNHVKVDVDLGAVTYTITINGASKTVALNRDRFRPVERYMKKMVDGEEKWVRTWDYGIKGISLGCYGDETETNKEKTGSSDPTVYYDNFKVYNDNSYNAYQDFNASTRADNKSGITQGWIMQSYPDDCWYAQVGSEGRYYSAESNSDDKAVKLVKLYSVPYSYQFNRPVAANTSFEMDFDIKGDATNNKNELNFSLLTKDQLYSMYENSPTNGKAAESIINEKLDNSSAREFGICTNDAKYYNSSVIFSARTEDSGNHKTRMRITKDTGTHKWTMASSIWPDNEGKEIPIDIDNKWAHVKLSGYPKGGKMAFVLSITSDDAEGNPKTITSQEFVSAIPSNTEFAAFGIATAKEYANLNTQITYLDNFTVKEVNSVSNAYVTAVKTVDMVNGETADLTSGLKAKGQNIEISFSEPVSEDTISNIKIYKGDPYADMQISRTLSADKKTVTIAPAPASALKVDDEYMLEIPHTVKTAVASKLSTVEAKAVKFKITEPAAPQIKVEDFRLYKYYEAGQNGIDASDTVDFAENWVPVAETELKDLTANDKFKFIAKGYNAGDTAQLWLGRAEKDPTTTLLTSFDGRTADAPYGKFEILLPATETADDKGFTMEKANGSMEAYLWDLSGLKPLCGRYVFSVTKTAPTETNSEN